MRTVTKAGFNIEKCWFIKNGCLKNNFMNSQELHSQQKLKLPVSYIQNNCIDILRVNRTIKKSSMIGRKVLPFVMNSINDIDTIEDLKKIEDEL